MRKALERLSAFEEATTGRLLSLKGLKVMGYMVVAGTVLDAAARKLERMNDETVRAQIREQYARQRAGADVPATASETDRVLQDVTAETMTYHETNTEETEDDR
ncbi:MAG TPA: hypothetical protein VN031_03370 [Candidatus Microsaccharimonas sp.]|nr:hypothetical protein [Candidatus Microsaccharimonas sp.]